MVRTDDINSSSNDELQREKLLQDCLVDLERIWQEMMESRQQLPFVKVKYRLRNYTDCMSGKAIADWFRQNEKVRGSGPEANMQVTSLWFNNFVQLNPFVSKTPFVAI